MQPLRLHWHTYPDEYPPGAGRYLVYRRGCDKLQFAQWNNTGWASCSTEFQALPKLILLDLYLPQAKVGWHLLSVLKTHYVFRKIPLIVFSRSNNKEDIRESYMFRANSYIVKPTSYADWLRCFASFRHYWSEVVSLSEST